jgi:hypothetical protein
MSLKALLSLLLALLLVDAAAAAPAAAVNSAAVAANSPEAATAGRWREHSLSFTYSGFTTKYSCDGLADKVRGLLRALGARTDLRVSDYGCGALYGGPSEFPRVKLQFATLEPLPATAAAETGSVAGEWRVVRIDRDRPRVLEPGDCELLEQFRDRVLPLFSTRAMDDRTRCIPNQLSGASLSLGFEVFVPARTAEPVKPAGR